MQLEQMHMFFPKQRKNAPRDAVHASDLQESAMGLKPRPRISPQLSSSHPAAEAGVAVFGSAGRTAHRDTRQTRQPEGRKPIVSIDGRDVEEIPETRMRRPA
jgi:hypothetical protein